MRVGPGCFARDFTAAFFDVMHSGSRATCHASYSKVAVHFCRVSEKVMIAITKRQRIRRRYNHVLKCAIKNSLRTLHSNSKIG